MTKPVEPIQPSGKHTEGNRRKIGAVDLADPTLDGLTQRHEAKYKLKPLKTESCKHLAKSRSLSLLCLLLVSTACAAEQLRIDGTERSYHVYQPAHAAAKGLPLMIVMHGGLGNSGFVEKKTRMDEVADRGQFLVAYPDGTGGRRPMMKDRRTWNAGNCCGIAQRENIDDVKFIKMMIQEIEARYAIDSTRIYVVGHSNGAMMAYRLACEIPERIAAIVSVSGALEIDRCERANDIAMLEIHGDRDENVPLAGGKGRGPSGVAYRPFSDSLNLLMRTRQCLPPEHKTIAGGVRETIYRCSRGAPIHFMQIPGGKHEWPDESGGYNVASGGDHFSASNESWEFARKFSKTVR